jgi:hypothetical protein
MDQDDLFLFKDLIDDAVIAPPRRPESSELTDERLSESVWILSNRSEDRLHGRMMDLLRKSTEVTEALGSDLDFVHALASDMVSESHPPAPLSIAPRPP